MNSASPVMDPPARRPRFPLRLRVPGVRRKPAPAPAAEVAVNTFVVPAAENPGTWEIHRRDAVPARFESLDAAGRTLGAGEEFLLALPLDLGLITRLRLPEAPPEDLHAMVRLQLEKVFSYAEDELGQDYAAIETVPAADPAHREILLAAYAVPFGRLLALCQPLVALGCWPRQVTFFALLQAAAAASSLEPGAADDGPALLAFREGGRTVVGVLERGQLAFAQPLSEFATLESLPVELPPLLLGAELEGVRTDVTRLCIAGELSPAWREAFRAELPAGVTLPALPALPPAGAAVAGDFSPPAWQAERRRRARAADRQRRVGLAVAAYAVLVALGFADLARLRYLRGGLNRKITTAAKPIEQAAAARKRWLVLAPATDFRQSPVEILDQVRQCLPAGNDDLRVTLFDQNRLRSPGVMTLEGEAPSFQQAIDLGEKLKTRPELRPFALAPEQPAILPNGRARFRVVGRLP